MATSLPQSKSPGLLGVWEHFTLADGLPDLKIECRFADSRGNLWVGTRDRGAARFDRERFVVRGSRPARDSSSGLPLGGKGIGIDPD
ncbi:MAG: hypothetical protein HYW07_05940 [Candidatus Latescibacteria bacterium]|nr:hypothetical protein [Candidatus Latescibacterota bacterium]